MRPMQADDRRQLSAAGLGVMVTLLLGLLVGQLVAPQATLQATGAVLLLFAGGHVVLGAAVALLRPGTAMATAVGVCAAWSLLGLLSLPQGLAWVGAAVVLSLLTMLGGALGGLLRRLRPGPRG